MVLKPSSGKGPKRISNKVYCKLGLGDIKFMSVTIINFRNFTVCIDLTACLTSDINATTAGQSVASVSALCVAACLQEGGALLHTQSGLWCNFRAEPSTPYASKRTVCRTFLRSC